MLRAISLIAAVCSTTEATEGCITFISVTVEEVSSFTAIAPHVPVLIDCLFCLLYVVAGPLAGAGAFLSLATTA